jgi:gamma-glutamyl:cysteine ligase YbdK (ATP-grasp superfamily)
MAIKIATNRCNNNGGIADIHSVQGNRQKAVEWLEKTVEVLKQEARSEQDKEKLKKLRTKLRDMKKAAKQ